MSLVIHEVSQLFLTLNNQWHVTVVEPEEQHHAEDKTGKETRDESQCANRLGNKTKKEEPENPRDHCSCNHDHGTLEHRHRNKRTAVFTLVKGKRFLEPFFLTRSACGASRASGCGVGLDASDRRYECCVWNSSESLQVGKALP